MMTSKLKDRLFVALCVFAVALPLVVLGVLLSTVIGDGAARLSWDFLTSYPSRRAEAAGVLPAIVGSLALLFMTAFVAIPVGVGAAIYLEEYSRSGRFGRLIEVNVANLASVPSILYGVLGLAVFVRGLGLGQSLLSGALTLALLVLPIIIVSAREALRTVPKHLREASFALGATRWRTIRHVVLPAAAPGIVTGSILATSRAFGETAPLVVVGALTYITFLPDGIDAPFTALPIQIFNWVSRPQPEFVVNAAAGIVVLLVVLTVMNGAAALLRHHLERKLS